MKFTRIINQLPIDDNHLSHFLKLAILNSLGSKTLWPDRDTYARALTVEPWLNVRTARAIAFLSPWTPNPESWSLVQTGI